MVHKKHQSKRISTRMGAKNHKRAMEKHRKDRKEAKKNPQSKRLKKDPGIPSLWPFKEQLLQEIEQTKIQAEEDKKNARLAAKSSNVAQLLKDVNNKQTNFNKNQSGDGEVKNAVDGAVKGAKDNSRKAYFREFKKVLDAADVILEVLDARDPLGCRTRSIEKMIMSNSNKKIILILNKIDLVPRSVVDKWIKYLRNEYPTIGFKASTQNQRKNIGQTSTHIKNSSNEILDVSNAVGADSLIKLLKNYSRNHNLKTPLTVGVIGYPNVGKSSLINSLKRTKVCGVGATPGLTKVAQEIHLDAKLKLLDCPGIVFAGSQNGDNLLRNCIKAELFDDSITPVAKLLEKCRPENLMVHYNLPAFSGVKGFLIELARSRGFIKKGGVANIESMAKVVLNDWNSGAIAFYTNPPIHIAASVEQAKIVQGWAKEFNIDELEFASVLEAAPTNVSLKALVMNDTMVNTEDGDESKFIHTMANDVVMEDTIEDEEEDSEEDEAAEEPQFITTPKRTKEKDLTQNENPLSLTDHQLNPQSNRSLKKLAKKSKRREIKEIKLVDQLSQQIDDSKFNPDSDSYSFQVLEDVIPMEE